MTGRLTTRSALYTHSETATSLMYLALASLTVYQS